MAGEADTIIRLSRQYLITVTSFDFLVAIVNTVRFTIQGMGFSNFAMIAGVMEMIHNDDTSCQITQHPPAHNPRSLYHIRRLLL